MRRNCTITEVERKLGLVCARTEYLFIQIDKDFCKYRNTCKVPITNEISIYVPYCNGPTITSLTFQDSVVKIIWENNSSKNKDYYVGKPVHGHSSYMGHDTTFWYNFGHVNYWR